MILNGLYILILSIMGTRYHQELIAKFQDTLEDLNETLQTTMRNVEDFVVEGRETLSDDQQDQFYLMSSQTLQTLLDIQKELDETISYNNAWYISIMQPNNP